jgi:hypothetical protein
MSTYEDITHPGWGYGPRALFVADETNCVQWIYESDVPDSGEPFLYLCEVADCLDNQHQWRRVWVIT